MAFEYVMVGVLSLIASWTDARERMIYNKHVYPIIAIGLVYCIITEQHTNIINTAIVFLVYLMFFLPGILKGGDLKLAVALTLFLGILPVMLGTALAGLLMATWGSVHAWRTNRKLSVILLTLRGLLPGPVIPFGILLGPLSLGVAVFAPWVNLL